MAKQQVLWSNTRRNKSRVGKNRDEAATAGTKMHLDIEKYYNGMEVENDSKEYSQFLEYLKDHPFKPYRTEWTVWDKELKLAGSIDMVYEESGWNIDDL